MVIESAWDVSYASIVLRVEMSRVPRVERSAGRRTELVL